MMTSKGKRPLRSLTPSDKIHAIQRIHDGESKASVARDIGVPESTLRGWCKNEEKLRYMSQQAISDKIGNDHIDKISDNNSASVVNLLTGPSEKRQKLDNSTLPLNFNKIKYDNFGYKRNSINGIDLSTNKTLTNLGFNGLTQDYSGFGKNDFTSMNGSCKIKGYGADLSRQNDPSITAISPLSSLSHLSGLTSLAHSPLAISFNELTTNLNLIAQLNPSLAAMSGLNGLHTNTTTGVRNLKPKPSSQSPRNDNEKPQQVLSVKNWAKQKATNDNFGMNLNDNKIKSDLISCTQNDDPLLYWLKSQQAMLGLNNLYAQQPISNSPIRSSTPTSSSQQQQQQQQTNQTTSTPPNSLTPQTPSSTPTGSSDDTKNSAWYNWCKAFSANLINEKLSTTPQSLINNNNNNNNNTNNNIDMSLKPQFDNILYSQLTKETENLNNNDIELINQKPEDLSAKKSTKYLQNNSGIIKSEADTNSHSREVLDTLLYKINNCSDSDTSLNDSLNNNKQDIKVEYYDTEDQCSSSEAIEHGEKFLRWLESYSNPRVTAMQVMQLRYLIKAIRTTSNEQKSLDGERLKIRRRK